MTEITLLIERETLTKDAQGLLIQPAEVISFTITQGDVSLTFPVPSFLSSELVALATDPDAPPFLLTNV